MSQRRVIVTAPSGLHARPAGLIARVATESGATVTLSSADGAVVDAKSILALMGLGVAEGDEIIVSVDSHDPQPVLDAIEAIVAPLCPDHAS